MSALISVTSRVTLIARAAQAVALLMGLLVHFGAIDLETADQVNTWMGTNMAEQIIVGVALIAGAFLPSVAGWISKDRELPPGIEIKDVEVKPSVPASALKQETLNRQAASVKGSTVALFIACVAFAALAAGCACNRNQGAVHTTMAQQQAAGVCVVQPQF